MFWLLFLYALTPFFIQIFRIKFLVINVYLKPLCAGQNPFRMTNNRLAKPLIGDDGRVYLCSGNNFFAFENNGSIAWTITLKYTCSISITPVHGGSRKVNSEKYFVFWGK